MHTLANHFLFQGGKSSQAGQKQVNMLFCLLAKFHLSQLLGNDEVQIRCHKIIRKLFANKCRLLITFANSLDLDQARQNAMPDLDLNHWTRVKILMFSIHSMKLSNALYLVLAVARGTDPYP